ncbi:GyrI-like domain-containing protein [Mobilitalea sibirica]|uniref:GyrI-like domain-containing protein n=1 Tax=Mobilitalea sibirica TaxID=1462919 RepID=A0A8J7H4R0_9FIRM|nr:GyrI-like domain-containing protein [Mobilitalea sibirica]MBH1942510.1 GyrI-like domain-containing protein [Mobilitalea sibirica]
MYRIGEFARLSGLTVDTLYHYEKIRILVPSYVDKYSGYRYYEAKQLVTVNKIMALKDADFSLDEIAGLLNNDIPLFILIEMLEDKSLSLEEKLNKEANRLERLRTNIFLIKNGGIPIMNEITMKRVEPILMASVRKSFHSSRFDDELEAMWKDVNDYIDEKGGKRTIPCMMLYHIGWGEMDGTSKLDVEVAEPITKAFESNEKIAVYELPAVEKMACIVHKGPFSTIGKTFDALFSWIKENGYSKIGPIREIYHKGEWETNDTNEYITELQIPIE